MEGAWGISLFMVSIALIFVLIYYRWYRVKVRMFRAALRENQQPQIQTNNENDNWVYSIEANGNERQLIRYNENDGSGFNSPNHNKKLSWKDGLPSYDEAIAISKVTTITNTTTTSDTDSNQTVPVQRF